MNKFLIEKEIKTKIDYWLERASSFSIKSGMQWYTEANSFALDLALKHNKSINTVAGLIAVFSPMKEWGLNKRMVECYLEEGTCGHTKGQLTKAAIINNGYTNDIYIIKVLGGRKTSSFYHNIVHPSSSDKITIDFRIWKHFKPDSWEHITPKRYDLMEQCFLDKALENHIVGCSLQAILWLQTKTEHGRFTS